ncbi:hypothetical protein [Hoyosella altamirensis]|uniref:hypothetical protein n=1 Tax=Hoyosella altamirensis TaxID=616997 RepID=UPI0007DB2304|nr:hypothetical protein [Hoyosella altamirensis]
MSGKEPSAPDWAKTLVESVITDQQATEAERQANGRKFGAHIGGFYEGLRQAKVPFSPSIAITTHYLAQIVARSMK